MFVNLLFLYISFFNIIVLVGVVLKLMILRVINVLGIKDFKNDEKIYYCIYNGCNKVYSKSLYLKVYLW